MLRKLLVSTAMAGVLATGAYAQDAAQPDAATSGDAQSQEMQQGEMSGSDAATPSDSAADGDFLQTLSSDQYLASNITGQSIYNGDGEDAEAVASIENYLVGSDGQIVAAIVTTEGDESRTVAVPFDQISWSMDESNSPRATMSSGADQLASMPEFTMPEEQQQAAAASGGTGGMAGTAQPEGTAMGGGAAAPAAPADGGMTAAPADGAMGEAPADGGMAAAPADGGMTAAPAEGDSAATGGEGTDMAAGDSMAGEETSDSSGVPTSVGQDQFLSEDIIGADTVSGPGDDAENLGSVNDLVVSSSGSVDAAVIGVGGFLGIGEKDVAAPFDMLTLSKQEDGTPQIIFASDRTALEEAPSFSDDREGEQSGDAGSASGMASESTAAAGAAAGAATGAAAGAASSAGNAADQAGDQMAQAGSEAGQATEGATGGGGMAAEGTTGAATGDGAAATAGAGAEEQMQPVDDSSTLTADDLIGTSVVGPNNDTIADISDIVLSPEGSIQSIIVDVGGFLGIGAKPVSINMDDLQFMRDSGGSLVAQTGMTQEELESAPEYSDDEASDEQPAGEAPQGETGQSN